MYEKRTLVKRVFDRLDLIWSRTSTERYVAFLRKKGIKIGDNLTIDRLDTIAIDKTIIE